MVFTAFSGSHQDAIKKGFAVQQPNAIWEVPYLPLDPTDVGRSYESVVRINSQSGKGGIAFLLERDRNLILPRRLQIEFSQVVQRVMDSSGKELTSLEIWQLFEAEYLQINTPLRYISHQVYEAEDKTQMLSAKLQLNGDIDIHGQGNGPIDAFVNALGLNVQIRHYEEHSRHFGSNADAVAYIEMKSDFIDGTFHGVGINSNIVTASLLAIISAVNRIINNADEQTKQKLMQCDTYSIIHKA